MKFVCLLFTLMVSPAFGVVQPYHPSSIEMNITIKESSRGKIHINGSIHAKNLLIQDISPLAYTIMVTLEYAEQDQEFPPLPQAYNSQQGFIYNVAAGHGKVDANSSKNRIKLLIAPLEKKEAQITLPFDELCTLPETTAQYRIVATLIHQPQPERIDTIFTHDIYGPIQIGTHSTSQPANHKRVQPGPSTEILNLRVVLMIVLSVLIILVVIIIFKKRP